MFPAEFIERINTQKEIDTEELLKALQLPSPVSVRINYGKWDKSIPDVDIVPWERSGLYLKSRPVYTLDPLFHAGAYYPQEASSMFTGEAFRQVTKEMGNLRVLDLCAAPGGKSTHLSSLLKQGDFLVANEAIRARASVLAENITKWGRGNVLVTQNDPKAFAALKSFFDIIVVDAPCSGEGMFRDSTAVNEWSPENTRLCSERQKRILMDVWPALKNGGILIYSTCTFNPDENENNVKWLIEKTDSESVSLDISGFSAITLLLRENSVSYSFYPGKVNGDGFFLSVIKKPGTDTGKIRPGKLSSKNKLLPATAGLRSFLKGENENVYLNGTKLMDLACNKKEFDVLSALLNVVKSGTMIGDILHGKIIPSHDLAMSARINKGAWQVYNATYDEAIAFLRMDEFIPQSVDKGRILICYRDIPLGFVNHLGNRTNNCYPPGWRIRMEKRGIFDNIL